MAGEDKPTFVYVTYIAAPPEKVWQALTEPDLTEKYWFGFRVRANGKAGERMTARDPAGKEVHCDIILVSEPPRRLVYAWRPLYDEFKHERPSRVTIDITPMEGQVRLTVTHDDFDEDSAVFEKITVGWPSVLSSLKSYLETGRALPIPVWNAPGGEGGGRLTDATRFKPKTVYVIYIAATPERVWQALTSSEFTARYFFGRTIEIEPRAGGSFVMRMPDGCVDVKGEVVEWSPPRRLAVTWTIDWNADMRQLPPCLVSYDIEPAGETVKLTLTEAYSWDVPEALLSGGRSGWPAILSSLKSVLETEKPLAIKMEPPKDMIEALRQAVATKPWLSS